MRKRIKVPSLVTILALTLITAVLWVGFEVIRIIISKPEPDVPAVVLDLFDPTLDITALDKLESRIYLTDEELNVFQASPLPTQPPTATPEPIVEPES